MAQSLGFTHGRSALRPLLALFLLCLASPALAQTVSFSTDDGSDTFGCGEQITVFVNIDAAFTDLRGFSWDITYDESVMSPVSVSAGTGWGTCSTEVYPDYSQAGSGSITVDVVGLGCSTAGVGSVLEVVFEAASPGDGTSAGTSSVSISESGPARDSSNNPIIYTVTPGSVIYDCNVAPVADDDSANTDEDTAVDIVVLANDSDVDGTLVPASVTVTTAATNGGTSVNANGDVTYTPNADFFGTDSFTYTVDDDDGATSNVATVSITVNDVNDDPVANDDSATTDEDTAVDIVVLANDSDVDGTLVPASVTVTTAATNGGTSVNANGDVTYTPNADFFGTDGFTYTVDDDDGATSNVATVTITVDPVNDPPVLADPGAQSSVEGDNVSLQLVATDVDGPAPTWSAAGLPAGLTINASTGEISGTVACDASTGSPYSAIITVDDGLPGGTDSITISWTVDTVAAPAAIADLDAVQVKSGNGTDGTTEITLTWSGVGGGSGIEVYRKAFGDYPEYDDGTGVVPPVPASPTAALDDDWILTTVNTSGGTDEPTDRDFWYYVAFVENPCGNQVSGPSNLTGGTLNYHLGDVAGGALEGEGDNTVATADVSALGAAYGITSTDGGWKNFLDVGPTTDSSVDGRPTTDNLTNFEDLILLAINFGAVSKSGESPAPRDRNRITLTVPAQATDGQLEVSLHMEADGRVQGLSLPFTWDPTVVEPTGAFAGELLATQGRMTQLLVPQPGVIDVAVFGREELGLSGQGRLATVTFRVIGDGDPDIDVDRPVARDATNASLTLETGRSVGTTHATEVPQASYLEQNFPNPFNPSTSIRFGLAQDGPVEIRLYSLAGRVIRTLVHEHMPAGSHTVEWDGRDDTGASVASGTYVVRLETSDMTRTHRLTLLR